MLRTAHRGNQTPASKRKEETKIGDDILHSHETQLRLEMQPACLVPQMRSPEAKPESLNTDPPNTTNILKTMLSENLDYLKGVKFNPRAKSQNNTEKTMIFNKNVNVTFVQSVIMYAL
ncbi:hypothetical protein NPIL_496391 [Nephila pilipes]|uniref:Uncharacterized protein n=1 Tax=Nephila pilipes TaxID=299642 RepID=A0A8X6NT81_NEPPI|nr:hypothetical protein NPIL_496391 [Nephila pilipes]